MTYFELQKCDIVDCRLKVVARMREDAHDPNGVVVARVIRLAVIPNEDLRVRETGSQSILRIHTVRSGQDPGWTHKRCAAEVLARTATEADHVWIATAVSLAPIPNPERTKLIELIDSRLSFGCRSRIEFSAPFLIELRTQRLPHAFSPCVQREFSHP